jgi:hypothetical protein
MEAEKWTHNAHEARFDPPDTVWITFHGRTELEDVRWTADLFRQLAEKAGPLIVASDVRDSSITPEAREFIVGETKPSWIRAALYIGTPLPQRAMGKAINLALILMGKRPLEMVFVDDAGQAREWIERAHARRTRDRRAR